MREELIYYFQTALDFRESLIPKDKPWNPKNEKYARCLAAVAAYIEGLPDEDPTLQRLAECKHLYDDDAGFTVPEGNWQSVIHCETDDPAAWFQDWAMSLIAEKADKDQEEGTPDE